MRIKTSDILKAALEKAVERKVKRVWYEPISGPCFEMMGYMGGWMVEYQDGGEDTLGGYNAVEAIEYIVSLANNHAKDEYEKVCRKHKVNFAKD